MKMKFFLNAQILIFSLFVNSLYCFALSQEQMVDRYLLEAQAAYKSGDHSSAVESFAKIEELNVDINNDFYYFYAKALSENGNDRKAWTEINIYLDNTGRSGKYYSDALSLYGVLETIISRDIEYDLSKLVAIQQQWIKLAQKYQINSDVENWLNSQVSRSKYLIDGHQYDLAITNIEQSTKKCNSFIKSASRLHEKIQEYNKGIDSLIFAVKNKQIDKSVLDYHYNIISRLKQNLRNMEKEEFLATYSAAKEKLASDIRETDRAAKAMEEQREKEAQQQVAKHEKDIHDNSYSLASFILNSSMCKQYSKCDVTYDKGYVKTVVSDGSTTKTAIIDFKSNSGITVSTSKEQNPGFITYSIEKSGKVIPFLDKHNTPTNEGLVFKTKDHLYGVQMIMPEPGSTDLAMSEPVHLSLEEADELGAFYTMEKNVKFLNECYSNSY